MREGFGTSAVAVLLLGAVACGGGGASTGTIDAGTDAGDVGAFCDSFTACGGNVVGTWRANHACAPPALLAGAQICGGETYDLTGTVVGTAWTFRADGTMSIALTTTGSATISFPTPCSQSGGVTVACADIGAMYERITFVGGKTTSGACHETGGTCTCPVTFTAVPQTGDGTYSTSGATLQFMLAGTAGTAQYCATATTLKLIGKVLGGSDMALAVYDKQ